MRLILLSIIFIAGMNTGLSIPPYYRIFHTLENPERMIVVEATVIKAVEERNEAEDSQRGHFGGGPYMPPKGKTLLQVDDVLYGNVVPEQVTLGYYSPSEDETVLVAFYYDAERQLKAGLFLGNNLYKKPKSERSWGPMGTYEEAREAAIGLWELFLSRRNSLEQGMQSGQSPLLAEESAVMLLDEYPVRFSEYLLGEQDGILGFSFGAQAVFEIAGRDFQESAVSKTWLASGIRKRMWESWITKRDFSAYELNILNRYILNDSSLIPLDDLNTSLLFQNLLANGSKFEGMSMRIFKNYLNWVISIDPVADKTTRADEITKIYTFAEKLHGETDSSNRNRGPAFFFISDPAWLYGLNDEERRIFLSSLPTDEMRGEVAEALQKSSPNPKEWNYPSQKQSAQPVEEKMPPNPFDPASSGSSFRGGDDPFAPRK